MWMQSGILYADRSLEDEQLLKKITLQKKKNMAGS
jgi:hypothetical protein